MEQNFKIPVYLILQKYEYDNEYEMLSYSLDRDEAIDILKNKVMEFAQECHMEATMPDWWTDKGTLWLVGSYIFELEERYIKV